MQIFNIKVDTALFEPLGIPLLFFFRFDFPDFEMTLSILSLKTLVM